MENSADPTPGPSAPEPQPQYAISTSINFHDRGRIPAIVSDLPEFTGNARNLSQWILDVEDMLELFSDLKKTFHYQLILRTIRRKIKNEANDVLITNNTPLEWDSMKDVLRLYYADKRDLITLDNQLKSMNRVKTESIEIYYSRIREMITLISSAISMDDEWRGHETALIKLYNKLALDTFIRGLGEPLSHFCKNFRPQSLAQAYHYCVEYLNLDARNAPFRALEKTPIPAPRGNHLMNHPPPNLPQRRPNFNTSPATQSKPTPIFRQFVPSNYPQRNWATQHNPPPRNVFAPNRTFYQQQPRPEPMDVDRSIRSRMLDYQNRPNFKASRPATESMNANNPQTKRVAHQLEGVSEPEYEEAIDKNFEPFSTEDEINETSETVECQQPESNSNVNFLENDTEWVSKWFD